MSNYPLTSCSRHPSALPSPLPPHAQPLTFYPQVLFRLSPVFNTWARLTAQDVYNLETRAGFEGQNIYFYLNHPIRWVRLVGVVVSFQRFEDSPRVLIQLDDGSGKIIPVIYFHEDPTRPYTGRLRRPKGAVNISFRGIGLHSVVKVRGEISVYRDQRQILLRRIELVETTNAEAKAWQIAIEFKRDRLLKPWVVSREEIEDLKKRRNERQKAAENQPLERVAEKEAVVETAIQESNKPKAAFIGRRREKQPEPDSQPSGVKREREVSPELTLLGQKRIKWEPVVDTVADRKIIQERLHNRENLEIVAAKAGKRTVYMATRYRESTRSWPKHDNAKTDGESKLLGGQTWSSPESSTRDGERSRRSQPSGTATCHRHRAQTERIRSITSPPPPPSSPDPETHTPRGLKMMILRHIYTTPLPDFSLTTLRMISEIESYAAKVGVAQNRVQASSSTGPNTTNSMSALIFKAICDVLEVLVQDGNIFHTPSISPHAYIAVGKWNLGGLIREAITTAKAQAMRKLDQEDQQRIRDEQEGAGKSRKPVYAPITSSITVRDIWLKAQNKGGGWKGVTKGVVAEVVKEVMEEEGDWKYNGKGVWEWEVQDRYTL